MNPREVDPLRARVRQAAPVLDDAVASAWSGSRAESALFEEITTMTTGEAGPHEGGRRRRWVPTAAVSAAAAAVVVGLLVGVPGAGAPTAGAPAPAPVAPGASAAEPTTAAAFLLAASSTAATQPGPPVLRDGQFWYSRTEGFSLVEHDAGRPDTKEQFVYEGWNAPNGTGRILRRDGDEPPIDVRLPLDTPPATDGSGAPVATLPRDAVFPIGYRTGTYQDLLALPTDPAALRADLVAQLRGYDQRPLDVELFVNVNDVLRGPAPPALRAALLEVASGIKGVELVGDVTDRLGRRGVAIAMTDEHGYRQTTILDRDTATVLAEQEVEPGSGNEPGRVRYESTVVASGVVDSTDARP